MSALCIRSLRWFTSLLGGVMLLGTAPAQTRSTLTARLAQQDFLVDVRQIPADGSAATPTRSWSTSPDLTNRSTPQTLRVRQGEKAALQWETLQPMQWLQSLQWQTTPISAASAGTALGGMTQAMVWMESGQSWTFTPYWKGGRNPVRLEIETTAKRVDERTGTQLPATQRQQLSTTVSAPLDEWVTLATAGQPPAQGTYRSDAAQGTGTWMQVRVRLP